MIKLLDVIICGGSVDCVPRVSCGGSVDCVPGVTLNDGDCLELVWETRNGLRLGDESMTSDLGNTS